MVELEKVLRIAAPTRVSCVLASAAIAFRYLALDIRGNMPRRLLLHRARGARCTCLSELLSSCISEQKPEGSIEDLAQIPVWDLMAEQSLKFPQLVVRLSGRGELNSEEFSAQRFSG